MRRWRYAWLLLLVLGGAGGWFFVGGKHKPTPRAASQIAAATLRDPALIAKGKYLAAIGDCVACHTARGGIRFAGGRSLETPFGSFPAPNITPDRETGLGDWSFEDFWQALQSGRDRHGELLYPAFPYTSYTKVNHDDVLAIFAYLQSLAPVHQVNKPLMLEFPYSVRNGLAAWRALYFNQGVYQPDAVKSAQWNRGAYLVQGLGHCNECHMTRDALGGMPKDPSLSGGEIPAQDWYAPDLSTQANGGLEGWVEQDIVDLLKTGRSAKGTAFGPMAEVVKRSTQHMQEDDLRAMAVYLQTLPPRPQPKVASSSPAKKSVTEEGARIYAQHCTDCHGKDGNGIAGIYPPLNGNSSVLEPTGINASRLVLIGGFAPLTADNARPYSMPPFAERLSDQQVAAVVSYIRQAWSNKASMVSPEDVSKSRHAPMD